MSWEGKQRNYNPWGSFPGVQTICFTIGSTWAFLQAFSRYCGGWGLGCCKKYHTGHRRLIPLPLNIPLYIQVHQPRACWHLNSGSPTPFLSWSEGTGCCGISLLAFPSASVIQGRNLLSSHRRRPAAILDHAVIKSFPGCSSEDSSYISYQKSLRSTSKGGFLSGNPSPAICQT